MRRKKLTRFGKIFCNFGKKNYNVGAHRDLLKKMGSEQWEEFNVLCSRLNDFLKKMGLVMNWDVSLCFY